MVCYRTVCLLCTWRPKGITWTVSSYSFSTMLPWMMSPTITWRPCTWPLTADISKWPKSSWIRRPTLTLKPWWESHTHWNLENTLFLFPLLHNARDKNTVVAERVTQCELVAIVILRHSYDSLKINLNLRNNLIGSLKQIKWTAAHSFVTE